MHLYFSFVICANQFHLYYCAQNSSWPEKKRSESSSGFSVNSIFLGCRSSKSYLHSKIKSAAHIDRTLTHFSPRSSVSPCLRGSAFDFSVLCLLPFLCVEGFALLVAAMSRCVEGLFLVAAQPRCPLCCFSLST